MNSNDCSCKIPKIEFPNRTLTISYRLLEVLYTMISQHFQSFIVSAHWEMGHCLHWNFYGNLHMLILLWKWLNKNHNSCSFHCTKENHTSHKGRDHKMSGKGNTHGKQYFIITLFLIKHSLTDSLYYLFNFPTGKNHYLHPMILPILQTVPHSNQLLMHILLVHWAPI